MTNNFSRNDARAPEGQGGPSGRHFARVADVDEFVRTVEAFERGELTPEEFRAFRLVRGVYGQRQDDVQMLRVKIPGGLLLPEQLEALADVAALTPRGVGHVTTRQNFQFHFVKLAAVEGHLRLLERVGITTRGACGNSVRNVTGCGKAGLCAGEAFDTTPYVDAITRHFLRRQVAETLPRKFKIALSGCSTDCAFGAINDIGLVAHRAPDGERRFKVLAAGGLATMPVNGLLLHESYPAARICEVAEALVRLFHRTGNRKNRSKARMKYVVKALGREAFIAQYREELERVVAAGDVAPLEISGDTDARGGWVLPPIAGGALAAFARKNVEPTRNVGRVFVTLKLVVGDITAQQMRGLAQIVRRHGDHTVRLTIDQNLLLRDVALDDLPALHRELDALGLADPDARTSADVCSCPGADSCKLAITLSKDLARALSEELRAKPVDDVSVKLSGCPNSCGQHHIATIGFHGGVRKIGDRAAPQYVVLVGGTVGPDGARFGRIAGKVPVRRVRETIERLIKVAERSRAPGQTVDAWLRAADQGTLKAAIQDLNTSEETVSEADFVDIGSTTPFTVVEMEGECAA